MITLGEVVPYQQKQGYSCSAATLLAVLRHYGITQYTEQTLTPIIGLTSNGAWPHQIVAAAQSLGLKAAELTFSFGLAKRYVDAGVPVIAEVASWNHQGLGHFVVVAGVGPEIQIMDPNTPGNWRSLSRAEMAQRWGSHAWRGVVVLPPQGAFL